MNGLIYINSVGLYLSKQYLKSFATSKTMEFWGEKMGVIKEIIESENYYLYKTIPYRTRKKLPSPEKIISDHKKGYTQDLIKSSLHKAYWYSFSKFTSQYLNGTGLTTEKATRCARLHSCFTTILELKSETGLRDLQQLHQAFNELFPGKYKTKEALSQAILKAKVDGIERVAIDKRIFGNNDREKKSNTPQVDYVTGLLVKNGSKYSNAEMLEKANAYFVSQGMKPLSLSWMKKQRRQLLKNIEIYKARYGAYEANRQMPFASLKSADLIHRQWQVDGFTLPFWESKFHRSILVYVIDNCSKKILGYCVGDTENSDVIKAAIKQAVYSTGVLPNEAVMDNHSFTKTQAAINFEKLLLKVGAQLTKTSNPRQKVIVERYNQHLNNLFKKFYGYLGKGILSKSMDARPSRELQTEYTKYFKSKEEILLMVNSVVLEYNNKPQRGISPSQLFIQKDNPECIKLSEYNRAELLPNSAIKQIRNGQITIMRGVEKFEYQLPKALFKQWNNEEVLITHDDLRDGIYLFDKITGEGIAFLQEKFKINNAVALQTEADKQALYKNKGRIKGIITEAAKELKAIEEKALNIDPEAHARISALTAPKDVIKELEQNGLLNQMAQDQGIITSEIHIEKVPQNNYTGKESRSVNPIKRKPVKEVLPVNLKDFEDEE